MSHSRRTDRAAKQVAMIATVAVTVLVVPAIVAGSGIGTSIAGWGLEMQTDQWLTELRSDSFTKREAASRQLMRLGPPVVPRLLVFRDSSDRELRLRAELIVREVARQSRVDRLRRFLSGEQLTGDMRLPGWERMQQIAGAGHEARRLWAAALQREWDFLAKMARKPDQAAYLLSRRLAEQMQQRPRRLPAESIVALMVSAMDGDAQQPGAIGTNDRLTVSIFTLLNQLADTGQQQNHWELKAFRDVVAAYIDQAQGPTSVYQGLTLAMRRNLDRPGLASAERVLKSGSGLPHVRQYAMLAMARFGDETHKATLEELLKDDGVLFAGKITGRTPQKIECQVRDLALACLMHLEGADPREQGFEFIQSNPALVFLPHTVGFADPEARLVVFQRYRGELAPGPVPIREAQRTVQLEPEVPDERSPVRKDELLDELFEDD